MVFGDMSSGIKSSCSWSLVSLAVPGVCSGPESRSAALVFRTTWNGLGSGFWCRVLHVFTHKLKHGDNWKSKINKDGIWPMGNRCWNKPSVNSMVGEVGAQDVDLHPVDPAELRPEEASLSHWALQAVSPAPAPHPGPTCCPRCVGRPAIRASWGPPLLSAVTGIL